MTSLKKYIKDNPHILENRDKTQGVLSDFFSGDTITVKRLMKGYDNGIIDVLDEENVDEDTKNKFVYKLVRKEDLIQDVAIEIFDEWANLLRKDIILDNKIKINNSDNINIISEYDKAKSNEKVIESKSKDLYHKERNQVSIKNKTNKTLNRELINDSNCKKQNRNNEKREQIDKIYRSWKSFISISDKSKIAEFFMFSIIVCGMGVFVLTLLIMFEDATDETPVISIYDMYVYPFNSFYGVLAGNVLSFISFRLILFHSDLEELKKLNTKLNLQIELIWRFVSYYISFPLFISSTVCLVVRILNKITKIFVYTRLSLVSFVIYKSYKIYINKCKGKTF